MGLSEMRSPESTSFVNRMHTSRGGTHVDVVVRQISQYIADHINAKMSQELDTPITARAVRRHLSIFVNCLIENPSFDSQMKECLTSNPENFGCDYALPSSFLRKLVKPLKIFDEVDDGDTSEHGSRDDPQLADKLGGPGIVEDVLRYAMGARQVKDDKLLREVGASGKQTRRQVLAIQKLEDANLAGEKKGAGLVTDALCLVLCWAYAATRAPSAARASEVARPIPLLPPMTTATWPASEDVAMGFTC